MPQDVSDSPKLKLVMLFNAQNQTYCICSHNLPPEEASQELDRLRRDRLPAFSVEQRCYHRAKDADECWECRADVAHAIEATPSDSVQL